MSALIMKRMIVTLTPCVPTLKDPMSVAVLVDIRVTVETAQVNVSLTCFIDTVQYLSNQNHFYFNLSAVIPGCSPSCGPNAACQEIGELPVCVCNSGFQGDGYNCTGW